MKFITSLSMVSLLLAWIWGFAWLVSKAFDGGLWWWLLASIYLAISLASLLSAVEE